MIEVGSWIRLLRTSLTISLMTNNISFVVTICAIV